MNKINIKNPLTIFTTSLKTEGDNLIVEAEEVEVIEEEKLYFYVKNDTGNDFTFLYDSTKTTFNDYIGVYAIDSTDWYIVKNSYDGSISLSGIAAKKVLYIDSSLSTPVLYTTPVIQGSTYYSKSTVAGGGSN